MRRGPLDVRAGRQRVLFGVDALERQMADITVCLLCVARETKCETVSPHWVRLQEWLVCYADRQRSDFELGGPNGLEKK